MRITSKLAILTAAMFLFRGMAIGQIPVEIFGGNKKSTLDVMFFKYFKNSSGINSRFLFFNRNRASADYKITTTTSLPQFGFTEAVSYNHEKLKGFAPVMVGQIFGSGLFPKAGLQYALIRRNLLVFTWVVCETHSQPSIDFFFLGRYTPKLTERVHLFSQLELVNTNPSSMQKNFSFTQRVRLGVRLKEFQFGAAADFAQSGRKDFIRTSNTGGFLRYEF